MQKPLVDLVAVTISNPALFGIYKNNILIEKIEKKGKTSDILPLIFDELLKKYNIKRIIYTKGPGSYMAIKLSFIFFKTMEIAKNIELFGADGFEFNKNAPIKAVGKSFFVKENGIITIKKDLKEGEFFLPKNLKEINFTKDTSPLYILNPV